MLQWLCFWGITEMKHIINLETARWSLLLPPLELSDENGHLWNWLSALWGMLIKILASFQSFVADSLPAVILLGLFCLVITVSSVEPLQEHPVSLLVQPSWSLLFWWINTSSFCQSDPSLVLSLSVGHCLADAFFPFWANSRRQLPWGSRCSPFNFFSRKTTFSRCQGTEGLLHCKAEQGLINRSSFNP